MSSMSLSAPPPQRPMSTCPVCLAEVFSDTMQAHIEQCLAAVEPPRTVLLEVAANPVHPGQDSGLETGVPVPSVPLPSVMVPGVAEVFQGIPVVPPTDPQEALILNRRAALGFIFECTVLFIHMIILRVAQDWSGLVVPAVVALVSSMVGMAAAVVHLLCRFWCRARLSASARQSLLLLCIILWTFSIVLEIAVLGLLWKNVMMGLGLEIPLIGLRILMVQLCLMARKQ
eukprot:RCo023890